MNTLQPTKISEPLQEDLAKYGILRKVAEKNAPVSVDDPNFFGVRQAGSDVELIFSTSKEELSEPNVQVSVLAPAIDSFDMLMTVNFPEAIKKTDKKTLREFVNRLLDEV